MVVEASCSGDVLLLEVRSKENLHTRTPPQLKLSSPFHVNSGQTSSTNYTRTLLMATKRSLYLRRVHIEKVCVFEPVCITLTMCG